MELIFEGVQLNSDLVNHNADCKADCHCYNGDCGDICGFDFS